MDINKVKRDLRVQDMRMTGIEEHVSLLIECLEADGGFVGAAAVIADHASKSVGSGDLEKLANFLDDIETLHASNMRALFRAAALELAERERTGRLCQGGDDNDRK
ncbi:MAG: hypothetical protein RBU21_19390 [FCB group bacterium]|nr:hypothetical protein [FCB group bacterium]